MEGKSGLILHDSAYHESNELPTGSEASRSDKAALRCSGLNSCLFRADTGTGLHVPGYEGGNNRDKNPGTAVLSILQTVSGQGREFYYAQDGSCCMPHLL